MRIAKAAVALVFLLAATLAVVAAPAAAGGRLTGPIAVSPGAVERITMTADRCPTFSWSAVRRAEAYELMVYRIGAEGSDAVPVLSETLPGGALSWTPPVGRCLEPGTRYAWSVRDAADGSRVAWSAPALFEVAAVAPGAELEEALAVVRRFLARGDLEAAESEALESALPPPGRPAVGQPETRSPSPLALGGADFSVDESGWVMAAGFEGDGSALTGVTAQQLAADGSDCAAGWAARGVNSLGQAQGCFQVPQSLSALSGTLQSSQLAGNYSSQVTLSHFLNSFSGDGSGLDNVSAAQLAANGSNCALGYAARGVSQTGVAESCFDVATQDELVAHGLSADHDARYVNAAGDTVSGDLVVHGGALRLTRPGDARSLRLRTSGGALDMDYSSTDLYFNNDAGNVLRLKLNGEITWKAQKSFYSLAPAAFEPLEDLWDPLNYAQLFQDGTKIACHALSKKWVAPVSLPHGATVTRVKSYWIDEDVVSDVQIRLKKRVPYTSTSIEMANVDSSGAHATVVGTTQDTSIVEATVDNESQFYYALLEFPALVTNCLLFPVEFHGLVIEYEVTRPH